MRKRLRMSVAFVIFTTFLMGGAFKVNSAVDNESLNSKVAEQKSVIDEPTAGVSREISEILSTNKIDSVIVDRKDVPVVAQSSEIEETTEEVEEEFSIGYTTTAVNVRSIPSEDSDILDLYCINTKIEYVVENEEWIKIKYQDDYAYMSKSYISDEETTITTESTNSSGKNNYVYDGAVLNSRDGVCYGPSGKETYYNLDMSGVIEIMRSIGNNDKYWIRDDGAKMLGDYVIVAADFSQHPRGSYVPTSLGMGIVCDTGSFVSNGSGVALDIATNW